MKRLGSTDEKDERIVYFRHCIAKVEAFVNKKLVRTQTERREEEQEEAKRIERERIEAKEAERRAYEESERVERGEEANRPYFFAAEAKKREDTEHAEREAEE